MSNYPKPKSESSPFSGCIESSVFALRERERQFFSEDPQSPIALRLASIRGEFQRLLAGRPVRVEVLQRAVERARQDFMNRRQPEVPEPEPAAVQIA
jgi:hypothetical protein